MRNECILNEWMRSIPLCTYPSMTTFLYFKFIDYLKGDITYTIYSAQMFLFYIEHFQKIAYLAITHCVYFIHICGLNRVSETAYTYFSFKLAFAIQF